MNRRKSRFHLGYLLRNPSLRGRLLGGFLLCALITAVSAGVGIWSLSHLARIMMRTDAEISGNLGAQNEHSRTVSALHALVNRIDRAGSLGAVAVLRKEAAENMKAHEEALAADGAAVARIVEDLLAGKTRNIRASDTLSLLHESCDQSLTIVLNAADEATEELEREAMLSIYDVSKNVQETLDESAADSSVGHGEDRGRGDDEGPGGDATRVASGIGRLANAADEALTTLRSVYEIRDYCHELSTWVKEIVLGQDREGVETAGALVGASIGRVRAELLALPASLASGRVSKALGELEGVVEELAAAKRRALGAEESLKEAQTRALEFMIGLDERSVRQAAALKATAGNNLAASIRLADRLRLLQLCLCLGAVVLAIAAGAIIARSITRPVLEIITRLMDDAAHTSAAARQTSAASSSLAKATSEQAATLVEASGSMQQIAAMTAQNSGNAQEAEDLMKDTLLLVSRGTEWMCRLSESVREIRQVSKDTKEIIKTIQDLAFQSNLLALNAAVEAARAGEVGRGFSVVAEEVRRLAQRSAEAARDTDGLIKGSIASAERVASFAGETESSLSEISESASRVGRLLSGINRASQQQSEGFCQVNVSVDRISGTTQSSAAHSQESAAVALDLRTRAESLMRIVEKLELLTMGGRGTRDQLERTSP